MTNLLADLPNLDSKPGKSELAITPIGEVFRFRLDYPDNGTADSRAFFVNIDTNEQDALEFDRLCQAVLQRDLDLSGRDKPPKMPLYRDKVGLTIRSNSFFKPKLIGSGPEVDMGTKARIHGRISAFQTSAGHYGINFKLQYVETFK